MLMGAQILVAATSLAEFQRAAIILPLMLYRACYRAVYIF